MESNDVENETHEHEWHVAFWQALQIGEVLWNVGCGAEAPTVCILIGSHVYKLIAESKGSISPRMQGLAAPTVKMKP